MSDRLVTERELEGVLRRLNAVETRLERERSEVPIVQTGTWTPAFTGSGTAGTFTYSNQYGFYERHGTTVHAFGFISISAILVAPTGTMSISGLPFVVKSTTGYRAGAVFGVIDQFNYTAAAIELTGVVVPSGSQIFLFESFDSAATVQVPAANFTNVNCDLQFSITYLTG